MRENQQQSPANPRAALDDDPRDRADLQPELSLWQRRDLNRLLTEISGHGGKLPDVLRLAMAGACGSMGWDAAFCRWDDGSSSGSDWHTAAPDAEGLEALRLALQRGPVARWAEDAGPSLVTLAPLIALPETRARESARDAGLAGYALLPILAAGKPVGLLELFARTAPPRSGGRNQPSELRDALEVLTTTLGLVATRDRLQAAVGKAAAHTRRTMQQLAQARAEPTPRDGSVLYDSSTGLPTGPLLLDRISQAIRRRQRSPQDQFAVVVAEVVGLDRVEVRGGDSAVEAVIVAAARRLTGMTRPADTTAIDRPGRFVSVVEGIRSIEEATEVAVRIKKELCRPFPTARNDVRLDVRIGLVLGGPAYDEPEALISDATTAAARAAHSRERVQVFDRTIEDNHRERERIRTEIGAALARREFHLEFQPIVSLQDGRITGLETFIRWRHPELGLVPPDQFIPIAAESPLIHDLGFWVLDQACEQINRWRGHLSQIEVPPVGVNVTGPQIFHEDFLGRVRDTLERNGLQGRQLRLDIGEAELMRDARKAATILDRLQGMGIDVAIDDFGTGYSSLSLLHDLPVRALKIDRSFISHRRERLRKWGVARTIVELAKILDVEVIAEGIETREQFLALRQAGCTQAQGYHFSGPVDAEAAEALIRDGYPLDLEAPRR